MKKYLIIILMFFLIFIDDIYADITDYNGGSSGSVSGTLGEGSWTSTYSGLKIGIVSSDGILEDVEIILDGVYIPIEMRFSTNNKPKLFQGTDIKWECKSTSNYTKSTLVPDTWGTSTFTDLNNHLSKDNYSNLLGLLELNNGALFPTLGSGDYITVEPMTFIGIQSQCGYFGTAFELANAFFTDSDNCWAEGNFCWTYGKRVFGGTGSNQDGGVFYQTIYLNEDVTIGNKTITQFSNDGSTSNLRESRNDCLKSSTCGRGLGIYKYDDIKPPEPTPEPEKYTFDLNYCVDQIIDYHIPRNPANFSYDFELDGVNQDRTYFLDSISSGTKYDILNIKPITDDYEYKGYNVGSSSHCGVDQTGTSITGTITQPYTSITLVFESTCEKRLANIEQTDGTYNPVDLFNLYKYYKGKNKDYKNLLNIGNPSCTSPTEKDRTVNNLTCLSGSTLSHANFHEKDLSDYDEIIYDVNGNYIGFCLTSMYLKNNLGVQKFYSKAGQFLVKEQDGEIELYNSKFNPVRVCGNNVATATVRKMCYVLADKESVVAANTYKSDKEVTLYFGDNNIDSFVDRLENVETSEIKNGSVSNYTTNTSLKMHDYEKTFEYKLNNVRLGQIKGKAYNISYDSYYKGIISLFDGVTSGYIPFSISYNGKSYGSGKELCEYETKQEIVTNSKLNMEFRIIDTNKPFERNTMSNWSDGTDNSSNNSTVQTYIKDRVNSYGRDKDGNAANPIYRIELTPSDIENIREYNKSVPYDNYHAVCSREDGKDICYNIFLSDLENGNVTIYDDEESIIEEFSMSNKLIRREINQILTPESTPNYNEINGVDVTKKICTPVTSSTKTVGNVPSGNYNLGDEYICEVSPGTTHRFFVVGTCGDDKVNMIMSENLKNEAGENFTISWMSVNDYSECSSSGTKCATKGPITLLNRMKELTENWTNVVSYNYTLIDEKNDYSSYYKDLDYELKTNHKFVTTPDMEVYSPIELEGVKARLLTRNEANFCGCTRTKDNCPAYLVYNVGTHNEGNGFWLSNATTTSSAHDIVGDGGDGSLARRTSFNGIRPVITVYKSQIGSTVFNTTDRYTLDINAILDNQYNHFGFRQGLENAATAAQNINNPLWGTYELKINGIVVNLDSTNYSSCYSVPYGRPYLKGSYDYCVSLPYGTRYEISKIQSANNSKYYYKGYNTTGGTNIQSTNTIITGVIEGPVSINLSFGSK